MPRDVSGTPAGVIWITGYSAAGKTTVCRRVNSALRRLGIKTVFLDGDDLRSIFGAKWGYEPEERTELARVYLRLASHLAAQGVTVVFSAVAMYSEIFDWFRRNVPNSVLAYLNVPLEVRLSRDRETKRVYSQLKGADSGYSEPSHPDVVIDNYGEVTPEQAASEIVRAYLSGEAGGLGDKGKGAYWNSVYSEKTGVLEPSPFSGFVSRVLGRKKRSFLEVGCGNGRDAVYFASMGFDVTAIDTSEAAIALCHKLHEEKGVRFLAAGISTLGSSVPSLTFDAIYSRFVLHAMTTLEEGEFLLNAYRVLTDGGALFVECRSINDPLARKGEIISPTERIYGHYRRFIVLEELTTSLESLGFSLEQVIERRGLAVFGDEDPVVIRIVARKNLPRGTLE